MTIHIISTRKAVEIGWDTSKIKGDQVSVQAAGQEVRTTKNDGKAVVTFPADFTGPSHITVRGSSTGEETGTIQV